MYEITSTGTIDAEAILEATNDLTTLIKLEFITDEDTILKQDKIIKLLYERVTELESRIAKIGG